MSIDLFFASSDTKAKRTDAKHAPITLEAIMIEILIAIGVFLLIVFVAIGGELVHWRVPLIIGASMVGGGLTVGIVVGISYHLALYRALAPTGVLRSRWWWRPTSYNDHVPPASRGTVMWWFYTGVTSMVVVLVGCAFVMAGIMMMRSD